MIEPVRLNPVAPPRHSGISDIKEDAVVALRLVRDILAKPSPDEVDAALLAATAQGDVRAFERLYRRFHGRVYGFAQRLTDRSDLADEVVTDTMMAVWRKAGAFEGRSRPSTWILGIAYRVAMKARSRVAPDRFNDPIDDVEGTLEADTHASESVCQRLQIAGALRHLPADQRATVELTYYHGYRLTEIAEITGCPVGTVKTRMFHARAKLRRLLGEDPKTNGARP